LSRLDQYFAIHKFSFRDSVLPSILNTHLVRVVGLVYISFIDDYETKEEKHNSLNDCMNNYNYMNVFEFSEIDMRITNVVSVLKMRF
jgi:hypothetical protein